MRLFTYFWLSLSIVALASCNNVSQSVKVPETPEEALNALLEGNSRFVNGKQLNPNSDTERVA